MLILKKIRYIFFQSFSKQLTYYNKQVILFIVIILPKTVGVNFNLKQYPTEAKIDLNVMIIIMIFQALLPWVESAFIKKHQK